MTDSKSDAILNYLKNIEGNSTFDQEYIHILLESHINKEEGEYTAQKIINVIKGRYVENKKSQT